MSQNPDCCFRFELPARSQSCAVCHSTTNLRARLYRETLCPKSPRPQAERRWLRIVVCAGCLDNPDRVKQLHEIQTLPDFWYELMLEIGMAENPGSPSWSLTDAA